MRAILSSMTSKNEGTDTVDVLSSKEAMVEE